MFSKKKCKRCDRKIEKEYDFCPYCGLDFRIEKRAKKQTDFGLLGRDDFSDFRNMDLRMPAGFGGFFNSLLNEVDKQMKDLDSEMAKVDEQDFEALKKKAERGEIQGSGISISISTGNGIKPEIRVNKFGPDGSQHGKAREVKVKRPEMSDDEARKLAKLPRKEAETRVRRMSNKIVYEIELPDVKSLKDVLINKLENSIEIKAFSENVAYFKLLPVNLPILDYELKDSTLFLELSPKG